ncbi:ABC transporter permease [Sinorhizobium sp. RAC02]|uniref:ABC transporter permease n=1 Tax=Sinorhizobium sp. RAC02 TaxID=1842534 RepID=UPI00083D5CBD|nr:ABC transporter permease [Sinorhizobium sp. RAC02]AOF91086.1 binding--dependent transport system inner membrane component family protein [Sinorhizobium sp. RAC02]
MDKLRRILFWFVVALTALFLLLPTLIIVPMSFTTTPSLEFPPVGFTLEWYGKVIGASDWQGALVNSLIVAVAASVLATVIGTAAALALHVHRFPGKTLVMGLLLSPMVTPVIVLAVGMYMVFSGWGLVATRLGLIFAHTVLAIPFVVVSVLASSKMVNPSLAPASLGLGAGHWFTFRRVTLPLIMPGVLSGAIFAFITSWDEVVIALFLADAQTRTVPIMIWNQVRTNLDPATAAVAAILIVLSALGVLLSYKFRESR